MHIGEKILKNIRKPLKDRYSICISYDDWKLFKKPLLINDEGAIDKQAFEDRQKKAIDIIEKILDIHGKSDIIKFLAYLATLEPKIQELQPWVRDHVVHAINTFILGAYILEKVDFPPVAGARFDYPFMWKFCGLTHDLGYPIEIARNINEPFADGMNKYLDSLNSPSPRIRPEPYPKELPILCEDRDAYEIIQERLNEWALGLNAKDYYKWLRNKNRTDHGVVSALAQLKVIEAKYYYVNPKRKYEDIEQDGFNFNQENFDLDIVSASTALFIHNIDLRYKSFSNKISFNIAPLSFLLFLCDTFQEWDRYAENQSVYSGNDFDIRCTRNSVSLFVPDELEQKISLALSQRLSGLKIRVNGKVAVS